MTSGEECANCGHWASSHGFRTDDCMAVMVNGDWCPCTKFTPTPTNAEGDRLAEIVARAEAATPGPWALEPLDRKYYGTEIRDGEARSLFTIWRSSDSGPSIREIERAGPEGEFEWSHMESADDYADANFTAHSREDIPYLLGEVERLGAALDAIADVSAERDALKEEVRYLRSVVDPLMEEPGILDRACKATVDWEIDHAEDVKVLVWPCIKRAAAALATPTPPAGGSAKE